MKLQRSSGVLLHPTSLPGPYGIGDLGPRAHAWVDFLAEAGCSLWQVLPLGPTGFDNSPYQSFSAFAGNPYLVSPELLVAEGLLEQRDLGGASFPSERVDFCALIPCYTPSVPSDHVQATGHRDAVAGYVAVADRRRAGSQERW